MNRLRLRKAFTVVEMVIVIAVIAVLATVMIPTVGGVIQKANESADTQFAASLSIQLAMWEADPENGQINNESDLRKAVNEFYGTDEVPDYYSTLTPKAAKTGYHIWYDVTNKQVVAGTYEDIGGSEVAPLAENDAGGFANSYRTVTTGKGTYFLMDHGGSEGTLAHHVSLLDQCNVGNYTTAIDHLGRTDEYIEADQYLSVYILNILKTTAIANDHGIFAYNDSPSAIYIPATTQKISANGSAGIDFSDIDFIVLPKGVSVASNALIKLVSGADGAWNRPDATTIYVDAAEADLKNLFAAESTNGVIQLPNGDRYIVDGADILKLTESGTENAGSADYTDKVKAITVTVDDGMDNTTKARIVDNTLYIAWDFTGDITVNVEAFADDEKKVSIANPGKTAISVAADNMSINNSAVKVSAQNAGGGTFTVTVQGEDYDFDVVNVGITDFKVNTIGGKTATDYSGAGYNYTAFYQLKLTDNSKASTFGVVFDIEAENSYVDVDKTVTGPTGTSEWSYADDTFTIAADVENVRIGNVTFTCGGKTVDCQLNVVNSSNSPFTVNSNADVSKYKDVNGATMVYHIGNNSNGVALTLGHLFTYATGMSYDDIDDQAITYSFSVNDWSSLPIKVTSGWTETVVDLTKASSTFTINISVGETDGKSASVQVKLIDGAYNVTDAASWRAVPNGNSIVLLNTIDLNEATYTTVGDKSEGWFTDAKCTGGTSACAYSINLGSAAIYGNLKTINLPTYQIKSQKTNNYFIAVGKNGSINDLIIAGPNYGTNCATTRYDTAAKNGYWVTGVDISGENSKISNCYISGFRNAVYVTGGKPTIENTTINGGSFANIYCHVNNTLTLTNVNTIQTGSNKGAGIFVDAGKTTFVVTNLKQYNFYTSDDLDAVTAQLTGYDLSLDYETEFSSISTTSGYHVGIIVWNEPECKHTYGGITGMKVTSHTWAAESATISSCPYSAYGDYEYYKTSTASTKLANLCVGRTLKAYGKTNCPTDTMSGTITEFLADPIRN